MQRLVPIASAIAVGLITATLAQASTPNNTPRPWDRKVFATDGATPTAVTDHMKCVITEVRGDRIVQIWDESTRSRHLVRLADEIPIQARRKKDFDGRETLGFEDLRPGHRIKLTYQTSDGTIVGVRVIDRLARLPE